MEIIIPPHIMHPHLFVAKTAEKGRGVYAAHDIAAEETIEICPVLVLPQQQQIHLDKTLLYDYYFIWGENDTQIAIALGLGSIYNHHYQPNAQYFSDYKKQTLTYVSLRQINAGEEITVNYNGNIDDTRPVWFEKQAHEKTN
ncbi:MAG: SET domain-containing protein [Chitinophagales bacterium]